MRRIVLITGTMLALVGSAPAAPLPGFAKGSVGEWLIVTDDGAPGCRVTLAAEPVKAGWRAKPAADCATRLPVVAKATGWSYEGGIRLLDAAGTILLDFQEDETTLMKTSFERPPVHFIVRGKPGLDRAPSAPALVGRWVLRRPGGPALCPLTLARNPKEGEQDLALRTEAPCDPAVARLRLDSARVEDVSLMLYGKPETSLRFEASGPDTYVKAEAGRPLELVRAP